MGHGSQPKPGKVTFTKPTRAPPAGVQGCGGQSTLNAPDTYGSFHIGSHGNNSGIKIGPQYACAPFHYYLFLNTSSTAYIFWCGHKSATFSFG
uniref:Uncharacterized protein n=1 Tax=Anguilla anguilla TaxID=7936 RepID=A0A0E9WUK7_ANGAN